MQEAVKRAKEEEDILKKQTETTSENTIDVSSPLSETSAFTVTDSPEKETYTVSSPFSILDEKVSAKPSATGQDPIPSIQAPSNKQAVSTDKEGDLSPAEKKKLVDALKTMSSNSALSDVKQTLDELKEDRQDFKEVIKYIE